MNSKIRMCLTNLKKAWYKDDNSLINFYCNVLEYELKKNDIHAYLWLGEKLIHSYAKIFYDPPSNHNLKNYYFYEFCFEKYKERFSIQEA